MDRGEQRISELLGGENERIKTYDIYSEIRLPILQIYFRRVIPHRTLRRWK